VNDPIVDPKPKLAAIAEKMAFCWIPKG